MAIDHTLQSPDPFSMIYEALWQILEDSPDFSVRVKPGNRVKFIGKLDRLPEKDEILTADLPEVRVIPAGGTPHLQRTSNSSSCLKRFVIQVATGDRRVDASLFPVEWAVYKALTDWTNILTALEWQGNTFVNLARPMEITEDIGLINLERGISGWVTVFACEIHMWFKTSDLVDWK